MYDRAWLANHRIGGLFELYRSKMFEKYGKYGGAQLAKHLVREKLKEIPTPLS